MSTRNIEIVELDRRLKDDPDGVVLKSLVERLSVGKKRLQQSLDRGVSKAEYARLHALMVAYDTGMEVLPKLWASINHGKS